MKKARLTDHQEFRLLTADVHGRGYAETRTGDKLVRLGLANWVSMQSIEPTARGSEFCAALLEGRWADSQFSSLSR